MKKIDKVDYSEIRKMSHQEKVELSKRLSKVANQRLRTLEKNNVDYYAYASAKHFLDSTNKKRFYQGSKFSSEKELNAQLQELEYFLNAKTSTMRGLEAVEFKRIETFREKYDVNLENEDSFVSFLKSKELTAMKKYADSNQILETFARAVDDGKSEEEIFNEFQDFMQTEKTFDEVQEILLESYDRLMY